ncbi:MAG: type II secretion system F family protein [Candidatus Micrarchaeia archaeon]|jgi:type II secretory pathway component PulF
MKLIELVVFISRRVPALPIRSKSASAIKEIYSNTNEHRYSSAALLISIALSLLVFGVSVSIPISLLAFALFFYFLLSLPSFELRQESAEIDYSLPFFLRELAVLVDIGIPFESALKSASSGKGKLEEKIHLILSEIDSGISFQKAASNVSSASGSMRFKRAASSLISVYEHGKGDGLSRLSEEMLLVQKHNLKDASSRMALFGIIFIVFSAVAPTFFLIYFSVGNMLFSIEIPDLLFLLGMFVVFPLISLIILLVAKSSFPSVQRFGSGQVDSKRKFQLNPFSFYSSQKKKEEIEKFLPDALMAIAATPPGSPVDSIFLSISRGGYGQLSKEFEISFKQLRSKVQLEKVLHDLSKRNSSDMLARAANSLSHIFATSKYSSAARLAEDFITELELNKERASIFSIQKYTLFFGAVLIPAILSIAVSLSSSMASFLDSGNASAVASQTIPIYMFIYCAMVSYFSAQIEGKRSMFLIYLPALFALSLITFYALTSIQ